MNNYRNSRIGFIALLVVTIVLSFGFCSLGIMREKFFEQIEAGYKAGAVVNLKKINEESTTDKVEQLAELLTIGNYVETPDDAMSISQHIFDKLEEGAKLDNLGALNLIRFAMIADSVDRKEYPDLQKQVNASRNNLHLPDNLNELDILYKTNTDSVVNLGKGKGKISVGIYDKPTEKEVFKRFLYEFNIKRKPLSGRLVKLTQFNNIIIDSLKKKNEIERESMILHSVHYAQTNSKGIVIFEGVDEKGYYSIVPLKKGYEYGTLLGTTSNGNLEEYYSSVSYKLKRIIRDADFEFNERQHTIKPFDALTYQQLKVDEVLTVRTPNEYRKEYKRYVTMFLVGWWLLWIILTFVRLKTFDQLLLPVLMTLSGICILLMYVIHNPLTDTMQGSVMFWGVLGGLFAIFLFSELDFEEYFLVNKNFNWYGRDENKKWIEKPCSFLIPMPKYSLILILGLLITLLLIPFGFGPEGSGVKVNLKLLLFAGISFQPSEIVKYLLIIYLAAFFCRKYDYYSEDISFWKRIKRTLPIFIGLSILLFLYLFLGDMGPALVLAITFILIYSNIRKDFWQMLVGTVMFLVLFWIVRDINEKEIIAIVSWLIVWVLFGFIHGQFSKKGYQFYESALFMNLVIIVFIIGGSMPIVGDRLQERVDIAWSGVWNNEVQGGDQVAHGIWALSSGGWNGQGFESGSPNVVPTFHTDMVLGSVGEVFGWVGLVLIVGCLALLFHRSILIGRNSGRLFACFLAYGIAIVTAVQFLIIAFGCIGKIPLTGVTVPLISFGRVSMILNLAAFGIILSLSQPKDDEIKNDDRIVKFDNSNKSAILTIFGLTALLLFFLFNFQIINRESLLIKPGYFTDRHGSRIVVYNPRINILIRNMDAGNIYDCNGLLIATSNKELIAKQTEQLKNAGISEEHINSEIRQRGKRRYYPFGDHMFFWTGNYNTRVLWDDGEIHARGYIAERRHLSYLRGFDTRPDSPKNIKLDAKRYKVNIFLPYQDNRAEEKDALPLFNYSELIPFLKQGKNSSELIKHNQKRANRDIQLTVDAKLQTEIQNVLKNAGLARYGRTSVVVLDASNGEILCSANYPLPDQKKLKKNYDNRNYRDSHDHETTNRDLGTTFPTNPGSTAKLMSAMAGFNKLNMDVTKTFYRIHEVERIRDDNGPEPVGLSIGIKEAIVRSSNVYFIKLVNYQNLYPQLSEIYCAAGLRLGTEYSTYTFYNDRNNTSKKNETFFSKMDTLGKIGTSKFRVYDENNPCKLGGKEYMIAWGQDPLEATPLAMARVVSAIVNKGKLVDTKYVLTEDLLATLPEQQIIEITSTVCADTLKTYMAAETKRRSVLLSKNIGGKSGTAEREVYGLGKRKDGWYIFYFENEQKDRKKLAVAVRVELCNGSGDAYRLVANSLNNVLKDYK